MNVIRWITFRGAAHMGPAVVVGVPVYGCLLMSTRPYVGELRTANVQFAKINWRQFGV